MQAQKTYFLQTSIKLKKHTFATLKNSQKLKYKLKKHTFANLKNAQKAHFCELKKGSKNMKNSNARSKNKLFASLKMLKKHGCKLKKRHLSFATKIRSFFDFSKNMDASSKSIFWQA